MCRLYSSKWNNEEFNVWFQKISIPPPWRKLEIWERWGGGEVESSGNSRVGGLTVKLTSRWLIWFSTNVVVRKLLLNNFGGMFWSLKGVWEGLWMVCRGFVKRITFKILFTISAWLNKGHRKLILSVCKYT